MCEIGEEGLLPLFLAILSGCVIKRKGVVGLVCWRDDGGGVGIFLRFLMIF